MDGQHLLAAVVAAASEASGLAAGRIGPDTTIDELGLDSLGLIELTVGVEEALGVEIDCGQRISVERVSCFVSIARARLDARMPLAA